ncbi:MAG: glycosyltransferase [Comamonadaceae bacterium]|nr:glycosyltransferase [Comamonadaceae bacterium]
MHEYGVRWCRSTTCRAPTPSSPPWRTGSTPRCRSRTSCRKLVKGGAFVDVKAGVRRAGAGGGGAAGVAGCERRRAGARTRCRGPSGDQPGRACRGSASSCRPTTAPRRSVRRSNRSWRSRSATSSCSSSTTGPPTPAPTSSPALQDSRLRYLRNPENLGPEGNWNRCVELANGRYFKLLPRDDLIAPNCLQRQVDAFERDRESRIALVFSARDVLSPDGRVLMRRGFRVRAKGDWPPRSCARPACAEGPTSSASPARC